VTAAVLRTAAPVVSNRVAGAYHVLDLDAPALAAVADPGQFVSLAVEAPATLLRRPFSVAGAEAGRLRVVLDASGPGTRWLAGRRAGERVDVVGPLGRGFGLPPAPAACLLVGGGYGAAPLGFLAERLLAGGSRASFVLGAATRARLYDVAVGGGPGGDDRGGGAPGGLGGQGPGGGGPGGRGEDEQVWWTTDDGTFGARGLVTDVLPAAAARSGAERIYACGPMPMLAAVSTLATGLGLACEVAVEEAMACGVGVCFTCVVPVRRDGARANLRACVDGPVLDGAVVCWEAVGG
jgi:dihydroorotate dehydrogenase electron transfer subunit